MNLCIMAARVFEPEYPHSLIDTIQSIQRPAYSYHSQAPRRFSTLVEPRRDPSVPYP